MSSSSAMGRVAIVHPAATFETHPTLRNSAIMLARAGYRVDVFIRQHPDFIPPAFEEPGITVCSSPALVSRLRQGHAPTRIVRLAGRCAAAVIESGWLAASLVRRHLGSRYRLVIGVDPHGIVTAAAAGALLRTPVAYFSLEIMLRREVSSRRLRLFKACERAASRRTQFVLVQDEGRAALLGEENGLADDRFVLVPNAPLAAPEVPSSRYWHERFGLAASERVVLYAGGFAAWSGLAEIIDSTPAWPDGWSLVVHLRKGPPEDELERLSKAASSGRVRFSTEAVPQRELEELFAAADVGIAFYIVQPGLWYTQENLRAVGLSSGKVAYYLRAGLPVIVNEGTTLSDFVREEGCGVVVSEPAEIAAALGGIAADYDAYRERALRTFRERLNFADSFGEVIRRIDALPSGQAHV